MEGGHIRCPHCKELISLTITPGPWKAPEPKELGREQITIRQPGTSYPGATDKQVNYIYQLGEKVGMDRGDVRNLAKVRYGHTLVELSTTEASQFIDELKEMGA